ncbi:MAG: glycogen debranching enzyme N-terminal domain-containing protein [Bacteroidales bacterium]|nr:glycogen debranching enzyme N-terminal domain-containing protein [Bacteroidales bacterium]
MGYLNFDKTMMINLEYSLSREILRTNRKGAYHCTTLVDCNTRKYHGLLVMPVAELNDENCVLLSSLDETVIQHGAEFNLGIHKYQGDNYSPKGHKYIRQFECETVPRTIYRVGGVILAKEKVFSLYENRILIKYTLLDAHSPTTIRFKPFLAFRKASELTYENPNINGGYEEIENGIKCRLYENYPDLYMQFNKKCNFVFEPVWYKGIEYMKELERGFPYKEDLYVPGYFELPIKKGETIIFSAGDSKTNVRQLKRMYEKEAGIRTPRSSFFNCLKNSAQQLYYRPTEDDCYLLAGYPWFKVRARDLFMSLPGCTLGIDDPVRFEKIMATAIPALRHFMNYQVRDEVITEIDQPDVLLWTLWALQQYANFMGKERCVKKYGEFINEIIDYIRTNKHPNLKVMDNSLLYSDGREKAISWMNSTVNGVPVIRRTGFLVEFNALWYNGLKFVSDLAVLRNNQSQVEVLDNLSTRVGESFVPLFLNKYGYLFDYVDEGVTDWSVRPNMIFAVSLEYSPLTRAQQRNVLNVVTKELLTPKGLRTLSPKSDGYRPYYVGAQVERDFAYHSGTAWPWLFGAYLEAYLRIFKKSGISFVERMLIGFEEEMSMHCIGTISELFDGNPPFTGRGAISFAMNVGAIMRVLKVLNEYNLQK